VFVLTHHPRPPIAMKGGTTFHFVNATPHEALQLAQEAAGGLDARIGGGPTVVRDFLAAGLVDLLHVGNGAAIGRVMPQVYAVGEDDTWIVAARYPNGDKSRREFFYCPKAQDHAHKNADEIVPGPFTEAEFTKIKSDLALPDWSKRF